MKMITRDVSGGKGGRCVRLTTYHQIVLMSRNLGALTLLDPSGPAWPVMGVLYLHLYLHAVLDQYVSLGHLLHNGYSPYQKTVNISEDATLLF
jgi:hypothetical protein